MRFQLKRAICLCVFDCFPHLGISYYVRAGNVRKRMKRYSYSYETAFVFTGETDTGEKASVDKNILLLFGHLKTDDFWKPINSDGLR